MASAGLALAWLLLGTRFAKYDDEGYALISLVEYLKRGHLYRDVYSQYGPFFFLTGEFCSRILRIPLSHDGGRLITFIGWAVASLLGGRIVHLSTRHLSLGAAACGYLFVAGSALSQEPMHPQFIVLVLSAVAICLSFSQPQAWAVFGLGVVGALLLLTKVNIGAFYALALLQTILVLAPESLLRTLGLWATVSFASALPYLLMRVNMPTSRRYCVLITACIASVSVVSSRVRCRTRFPSPKLWICVAGGAVASTLVVTLTLLRGSTPADLVNGVILWNLHLPEVFSSVPQPSNLKLVVLLSALVPVTAAVLWIGAPSDRGPLAVHFKAPLGALCFAGGLLATGLFARGLALIPLGFIPILVRRDFPLSAVFGRLFIMNWCALGFLHTWPVAGSQVNVATFPLLIWAFIIMGDGISGVRHSLGRMTLSLVKRADSLRGLKFCPSRAFLARASAVAVILHSAHTATTSELVRGVVVKEYLTNPASRLDGASFMHLPPTREVAYDFLSASVRRNCDLLFTLPGMASFNLWSDVPPPNGWNLTAWMKGFDLDRQQSILEVLQEHPRSCVIQNKDLIRFWQTDEARVRQLPLGRYILERMPTVAERSGYAIRVHPERNTPWIPVTSSY